MRYLIPAAFLLTACSGEAPVREPAVEMQRLSGEHLWAVDEEASSVCFTGNKEGEDFTGCFSDFDVQINLDPDDTSDAQIVVVIGLASADSGDSERDEALPTSDWFEVKTTPEAVFRSDSITRSGGEYRADGELTLKGTTLPVTLPFTLDKSGDTATASGAVTLDRQRFGVGSGAYDTDQWIAFPVRVEVEIAASRME